MDFDQFPGAGAPVQHVDVLGDDSGQLAAALELGQDEMGAVGPDVAQGGEALSVEAPEPRRIAAKHVDVGHLHRVHLLPQPGSG